MPPDQAEVLRWLTKARHDWSAARKILTPDCEELDTVAFHCQQAVEKILKDFLVHRRIGFEKVHDLGLLLDRCADCEPEFESLRSEITPLTIYAVAFRYPGPGEPSRKAVESAMQVVERTWNFTSKFLPEDVIP